MPTRPDLRDIASNVRDAFADLDKDALLDILTFVVKEYVVEGPPPMLVHQAETLGDLKTATFAQLISALQTRFDFPELAMFVVDGEQVGVRVGGVVQPLIGQRQPLAPPPQMQVVDTRPQPSVRVVETTLQQRPQPAPAPPPSRGLSVRGRPADGEAPAPPPQPAPAPAPAPPAANSAAPEGQGAKPDKPEGSGDDASARFSLLELD
ncbi:MAG TPA: hypothetical protein VH143_19530 [Kofleriaceae bacterium]|jgi:hypothetical protein|nr:hypothetical protein [Kofleriaceae bacterium]